MSLQTLLWQFCPMLWVKGLNQKPMLGRRKRFWSNDQLMIGFLQYYQSFFVDVQFLSETHNLHIITVMYIIHEKN